MGALCATATAAPALYEDVVAARVLAGKNPEQAHAQLAVLRQAAIANGQTAKRIAVDEVDCRLLSDSSAVEARRVAEAAVAAASSPSLDNETRASLLRLQACAAGTLLDLGELERGSAELDSILHQSADSNAFAAAHALALLERGLHRSRRDELQSGQQDLIEACSSLQELNLPADLELCRAHLANHYKRMGDFDEALRLLDELLREARQRGASFDASVYVYALAQVHFERRDWQQARTAFEEAVRMAQAINDRSGNAYAQYGLAHTLLRLKDREAALVHAQSARRLLEDAHDPVQLLRTAVLECSVLAALKRADAAATELQRIERDVRSSSDPTLLVDWLSAQSQVKALQGSWRDAYEALAEWRPLDARVQEQRLSEQSARLRLQFDRQRDASELAALRRVDEQRRELVQTQRMALALFIALLLAALSYAVRKFRHARRLHGLAMLDELTGLPNRRATLAYLDDQLRQMRAVQRPVGILMIDIDHFKAINDRFGHAVGDEVLRSVGSSLAGSVRSIDRAGRLGGEEFLVVLPETSAEHATAIAERMRRGVANRPVATSAGPLDVTVSIGVAAASNCEAGELMNLADRALYVAKNGGRDRIACADQACEVSEATH